jgi:hypothetical protein
MSRDCQRRDGCTFGKILDWQQVLFREIRLGGVFAQVLEP